MADFVGTRSGFLRYRIKDSEKAAGDFLTFNESPFHDEYFKIAASVYSLFNDKDFLVFWVPTQTHVAYGGNERQYFSSFFTC